MNVLWWHWIVFGMLLVVGELATPGGFYIIFFGTAAIVVGLASAMGLTSLALQFLLFSTLSVGLLLLFRARLLRMMRPNPAAQLVDTLVGEIGTVTQSLTPGSIGKVEVRGASWSARNISSEALAFGVRCRVTGVDGLLLHVGPEGGR